jgi:hypothetical protein
MASLADYLRNDQAEYDANLDNLARSVNTYGRNQQVLEALGAPAKSKQKTGILSKIGTVIDTPGRLVRGGLLELLGTPTAEMKKVSGLEQAKQLFTGELKPTGMDFFNLNKQKGGSFLDKAGRNIAGLGIEILTDPTSWITAPASISRKAAATTLMNIADKPAFLERVVSRSSKGANLIDELVAGAPVAKAAKIQEDLVAATRAGEQAAGILPEAGTPLDVLAKQGRDAVAAQELANKLSTTFYTKGRRGLVKELENLTGSKSQALAMFKELPDEIRGGLILQKPIGGAFKGAGVDIAGNRQALRLTSGAGELLGPVGDAANFVRQGLGMAGNVGTRYFSGKGGDILADAKKAEWQKLLGKTPEDTANRFIDYTTFRKGLQERNLERATFQAKTTKAFVNALASKDAFKGVDAEEFEKAFKNHFFSPGSVADNVDTPAYQAGVQTAKNLRDDFVKLYEDAKAAGVDIGNIGSPYEYSPLMLTDAAHAELKKLGITTSEVNSYNMDRGRGSHIEFMPDEAASAGAGWKDPETGVTYLSAQRVNDNLEKAALAAGKSAEEAAKARIYIEDPLLIIQRYGNYVANAAATRRFVRTLEATGTVIRDIPEARRLLNEWNSSVMAAGVEGLAPKIRKRFEDIAAERRARINKLVSADSLEEQQKKVAAERAVALDNYNVKKLRVNELRTQVANASSEVADAAPSIGALRSEFRGAMATADQTAAQLDEARRAAKNANDRLREARAKLGAQANERDVITSALSASDIPPAEFDALNQRALELSDTIVTAEQKVATEQATKAARQAEVSDIRKIRESATGARAEQVKAQLDSYEGAVAKRDRLVAELAAARAERDIAGAAARRVADDVALESTANLQTLVDDFVSAASEERRYRFENPITAVTDDAQKAAITAKLDELKKAVKTKKEALTQTLSLGGKKEFKDVAGEYVNEVLKAAEELSEADFTAFMALTDEKRIGDLLATISDNARDSEVAMKAVNDLYSVFARLKKDLPDDAFENLTKAQKKLMDKTGFDTLKSSLVRAETQPGAIARGAVQSGLVSMSGTNVKAFKDLYASSSVLDAMNEVYRSTENTSAWEKFTNDYLDRFLGVWKLGATTGRGPGFIVNNLVGGMYNNYLGGVSPKYAAFTVESMLKMRKAVKKIEKLNPNMTAFEVARLAEVEILKDLNKTIVGDKGVGELWAAFNRLGGFEGTDVSTATQRALQQTPEGTSAATLAAFGPKVSAKYVYQTPAANQADELFRQSVDFLVTNKVMRTMNDMQQSSEVFLRFSAFLDGYQKFGDLDAAMSKVHMLHFDYGDLGAGEEWLRRFMPFYTWTRNNVPLQLRSIIMQPGKIQKAMRTQQAIEGTLTAEGEDAWLNEVLPEWISEKGGFITSIGKGTSKLALTPNLPYQQLNELFQTGKMPVKLKGVASLLGPQVKIPIELGYDINLETGQKDTSNPIWKLLKNTLPQTSALRNVGTAINPLVESTTGLTVPFAEQDKALQRGASITGFPFGALGLQTGTVTPNTTAYEITRRNMLQSKEIKQIAEQLGVDPDWIRSKLKKGLDPQFINALLQAGAGRVAPTFGAEPTTDLTQNARQQALDTILGL